MTSFFNPKFSKDFPLILNNDNYDTIIQVGENEDIKEFRAHSVILRARSPYFEGALSSSWVKKENDMIIFNKPNITPNVFEMILRYIYTGELNLEEQLSEDIFRLLIASDELLFEELISFLQEYILEQRQNWVDKEFFLVFYTVRKLANCELLQNYCFKTISNFDRDIYHDLLKREELLIKEIVAWNYLIIWGIEQTSGLGSLNCDRNKRNNEDYEALKETLHEFIPLIRFTNITFDDFNNKVRPYKNIIPNQIYEEIEEFYNKGTTPKIILPPRMGKFDSKIIKPKLAKIIIEWINIEDFWISRYNFIPIYRGSIDGISNKSFINKCKGQVGSLVLIKVNYSNKIFGGYSSIGFNSIENSLLRIYEDNHRFYHSSNNFIFSLENDEDTQNMKISRVINYDKAIYDHPHNGFNFGYNAFFMTENHCIINNYSCNYENNIRTDTIYSIEEIETFIITEL
ncbi:hypothetical protein RirG_249360 [Rhizophagus irregularis DAOM 197198w]|uniref:Serine-enriched protein n=2 Tax=Rhizophagus irregularis TaxID=588596 RepID=A0A015IFS7_RHIIW|nr:hypothetical protein RirG_249360 [Rhizophagus irregularis DAOM 197198w]